MSGFTDMAKTEDEAMKDASPLAQADKYPWGLRITLTQDELEKLGVDHSDWEIGDTYDLRAMAKVTSISKNETEDGESKCCVSLQITHLQGPENEDEEEEQTPRTKSLNYEK